MKNTKAILLAVALLCGATANAQGLGDLLKGIGNSAGGTEQLGGTIGNVLSGIFSSSNLTLQDLVGSYVSDGPAVTFKSDNFLQKAGGIAGAAALESKLQPYYEQYGLTGMPLTIDADGKFTLAIKGIKLSGTVEPREEKGEFDFNIMVANKVKIGKFTAYIMKSGKNLDLMFDATKLKDFVSTVGKFTGQKLVSSMTKILDSYDGANIGFKMTYTGEAPASSSSTSVGTSTATGSSDTTSSSQSGIGTLFNILNNRSK